MFEVVSHWDKGAEIKGKLRTGSLTEIGGYKCHSDNLGLSPRKSEYTARDGLTYMHPSERPKHTIINTGWENGCKHITSDKDAGCNGCKHQKS